MIVLFRVTETGTYDFIHMSRFHRQGLQYRPHSSSIKAFK